MAKKGKFFVENFDKQLRKDDCDLLEFVESCSVIDESVVCLIHKQCDDHDDVTMTLEPLIYEDHTGKLVSNQGSHTVYSKYQLSAKVETMILKNEVFTMKLQAPKIVSK